MVEPETMSSIRIGSWSKRSLSQERLCIDNSSLKPLNEINLLIDDFESCYFMFDPILNFSFTSTFWISREHGFLWTLMYLIDHIGWVLFEDWTVSWPLEVHFLVLDAILLPILLEFEIVFIVVIQLKITFLTSSNLWIVVNNWHLTIFIMVFYDVVDSYVDEPFIVLSI